MKIRQILQILSFPPYGMEVFVTKTAVRRALRYYYKLEQLSVAKNMSTAFACSVANVKRATVNSLN